MPTTRFTRSGGGGGAKLKRIGLNSVDWQESRNCAAASSQSGTANWQSFGGDASDMALKQLYQLTHAQGVVMAFADVFLLLTILFVVLAGLAVVVKKPAV